MQLQNLKLQQPTVKEEIQLQETARTYARTDGRTTDRFSELKEKSGYDERDSIRLGNICSLVYY